MPFFFSVSFPLLLAFSISLRKSSLVELFAFDITAAARNCELLWFCLNVGESPPWHTWTQAHAHPSSLQTMFSFSCGIWWIPYDSIFQGMNIHLLLAMLKFAKVPWCWYLLIHFPISSSPQSMAKKDHLAQTNALESSKFSLIHLPALTSGEILE